MSYVIKLDSGKVVVNEAGVTKVLTPPKGVSYNEDSNRWSTSILNKHGDWTSRSWSVNKHGIIDGFEMAVEARNDSLNFLLTRRMLPRIRRTYVPLERGVLFVVRDPIDKIYRSFSTLEHAKQFNLDITAAWMDLYKFDMNTMIQIDRSGDAYSKVVQQYNHIDKLVTQPGRAI